MTTLNLEYRARVPETGVPAPAVVLVHGWLGDETVMWIFAASAPAGAALFSPRAPFTVDGGYGWSVKPGDAASFERGQTALREFVLNLPRAYPVDPARLALVGFSQGAAMAGTLLLAAPELARGAALLSGFLPPEAAAWATPGRLAGKRVFLAHGRADETVAVDEARRVRDLLTGAGAATDYGEYDVGHKMNPPAMRALKHWLAETLA